MELSWQLYNPETDAQRILILGASLGGDCAHQWGLVAAHLARDAYVVFVDFPGHGTAVNWGDEDGEATMTHLADRFAETVKAVHAEVGELPTYYAGLSLSGALGLYLAHDHFELFQGVVVLGSAATIGTSDGWLQRAERVEEHGTVDLVQELRKRWFTNEFAAAEPDKVTAIMEGLAAADDHSYAQLCRALATHDSRGRLSETYTPLLVITGGEDYTTPMNDAELVVTSAPNADLRVVPDVAHQITVAAPGTVADLIRGFFRRVEMKPQSVYDITDPRPE